MLKPLAYLKRILKPRSAHRHAMSFPEPRVRVPSVDDRWQALLADHAGDLPTAGRAMVSLAIGKRISLCGDQEPSDELRGLYTLCDERVKDAKEAEIVDVPVGRWVLSANDLCDRLRGVGLVGWAGWYERLASGDLPFSQGSQEGG